MSTSACVTAPEWKNCKRSSPQTRRFRSPQSGSACSERQTGDRKDGETQGNMKT